MNEENQPKIRTVRQLLNLLEEHQIELDWYYARPSQAHILSFSRRVGNGNVVKYDAVIPIEIIDDAIDADYFIEKTILDAVHKLEKFPEKE